MMAQDTVSVELLVSDWQSVLSVLKETIQETDKDADTAVVEELTLLYEEIDRQLTEAGGAGHAHGLYSSGEESRK